MARPRKPGRGELDPPPPAGYPSAADIPEFKKMHEQLRAMQVLLLFKPSMRGEFKELKKQFEGIVDTVERYYAVIGERHWVFHESLNLDTLVEALDTNDADEVERAVIAHYQDEQHMKFALMMAKGIREMQPRGALLDAAYRDYQEGRYYAVVLVLLAVMDGFVNEVGEQRRGLHTRAGEELVAWNSVTAHHQGLAATQKSFTKSFNKTSDQPVFELYRNGIMHGNFTSFDNIVVASKAWNRLFAVLDWSHALEEAMKPDEPLPSLRVLMNRMADTAAQNRKLEKWKPRKSSVEEDGREAVMGEPVVQATMAMLEAWTAKNYGRLASFLHEFIRPKSPGAFIGEVRARFEGTPLIDYQVRRVDVRGAGCAHVWVDLTVNGETRESELRWIYVDSEGHVNVETDTRGSWQCVQTDPLSIVGRKW